MDSRIPYKYIITSLIGDLDLLDKQPLLPNGSVKLLEVASFSRKTTFLNGYKIFLEYTINLVFLQYDILFQEEFNYGISFS